MEELADAAAPLRHAALFYRAPGEFTETVMRFVRDGIGAGEAVLIAATGPNLYRLRAQLDGLGKFVTWADISGAGANPRRITTAIRMFAQQHPGQLIRCVQEPAWYPRPAAELREVFRHEALVNLALTGVPATVLCAYDPRLGAAAGASVEGVHPLVVRDGRWLPSARYAGGAVIPAECDEPLSDPPPDAVSLAYREDLAAVRRLVTERARLAGLSADRAGDLVLAVGELSANTLMHTAGPGRLTVWAAGGEIVCQIDDTGRISDPLAGTCTPDAVAPGGGRGLWVVHQVCDLVEMRTGPGGTTTRLHMRLAAWAGAAEPGPAGNGALTVRTWTEEGIPVIGIAGELDLSNTEQVRPAVEGAIAGRVERLVFDLRELDFLDSSGIALLAAATRQARTVELRNPGPVVRRLVELTGLTHILRMTP